MEIVAHIVLYYTRTLSRDLIILTCKSRVVRGVKGGIIAAKYGIAYSSLQAPGRPRKNITYFEVYQLQQDYIDIAVTKIHCVISSPLFTFLANSNVTSNLIGGG